MSPFFPAWAAGDARACALLPDRYRRPADRRAAVELASARALPPGLLDVLRAQNARLPASEARARHLEQLGTPGTTAVVTGQQMGLFLGPLFTLYKAASAIVTARALAAETQRPCVPVFWMQTEDHDLAEIDHCFVPTGGAPLRLDLDHPDASASRAPVGALPLGPGVVGALRALRDELGRHPFAEEHLALLERAYRPEATLAGAFAEVLSTLFAEDGLILIDPRDPALAPFSAPVHRRAVLEASRLADALAERTAALSEAGFAAQVHIRPESPLCFVSPEGAGGPRFRLDPLAEGRWSLVGRSSGEVSTGELLGWLERDAGRFTTSALLRPLLQDSWLPTAAYVGGPGEVAYFAQLAPLYDAFDLPMPLIVPRARFLLLDDRTRALLEKLGLTAAEASGPRQELLARLASAADHGFESPESVEVKLLGDVSARLARFAEEAAALDPSLSKASTRAEEAVRDAVTRLVAKYGRVLARRDEVTVERLDRLRALLYPDQAPQERVYSLPYFACRFGQRELVRRVLDECVPFSATQVDLTI